MNTRPDERTEALTQRIIGAAFEVANGLGHGFLEVVYQKALVHEIRSNGLNAETQVPFPIRYKGIVIGTYIADVVVERAVIVELKTVDRLVPAHIGQVLNYLRASNLPVGLLFNFAKPKLEYRRVLI